MCGQTICLTLMKRRKKWSKTREKVLAFPSSKPAKCWADEKMKSLWSPPSTPLALGGRMSEVATQEKKGGKKWGEGGRKERTATETWQKLKHLPTLPLTCPLYTWCPSLLLYFLSILYLLLFYHFPIFSFNTPIGNFHFFVWCFTFLFRASVPSGLIPSIEDEQQPP